MWIPDWDGIGQNFIKKRTSLLKKHVFTEVRNVRLMNLEPRAEQ